MRCAKKVKSLEKEQEKRLILPDINMYHKVTIFEIMCFVEKWINRTELKVQKKYIYIHMILVYDK